MAAITDAATLFVSLVHAGEQWRIRRKAVGPSLHRAYLEEMLKRVFGPSSQQLVEKLKVPACHRLM
jgi:carotene epsilon-monooxygenase